MARGATKKGRSTQKTKGGAPLATPASDASTSAQGVPYVKLLIFIGVILAILYGPSLFKKGSSPSQPQSEALSKVFAVKKVAQFSGDNFQKGPVFANDIIAAGPHEMAMTDNLGAQVLLCDFKGKLIRKWGKNGAGPKEFQEPSGIATDHKGHLFVLDTLNNAVKTFDMEGRLLNTMPLSKYGYFSTPRRLGWADGNLLISNGSDARLARLSQKGDLQGPWGEKGAGKGGLWGASKAIADGKGHYYVGDCNLKDSRVRLYDGSGNVTQEIKTGMPADSLGLDRQGRLFVVSYGEPAKVFDAGGSFLGYLVDEDQPSSVLNQIAGIDVMPNGMILTCGGNNVTLYQEVAEGTAQKP